MKEKKSGIAKYRAAIAICSGIVLSLLILTFSNRVTTPNRNNPYFSYGTEGKSNSILQVTDSQRLEVPMSFEVGQGVAEVQLEFSGEHELLPGLNLTDKTVPVVDGRAVSKLVIQFSENPGLKAGTHYLTVVARDTSTGKIVREGEIYFTYNMHEVIGKCSC